MKIFDGRLYYSYTDGLFVDGLVVWNIKKNKEVGNLAFNSNFLSFDVANDFSRKNEDDEQGVLTWSSEIIVTSSGRSYRSIINNDEDGRLYWGQGETEFTAFASKNPIKLLKIHNNYIYTCSLRFLRFNEDIDEISIWILSGKKRGQLVVRFVLEDKIDQFQVLDKYSVICSGKKRLLYERGGLEIKVETFQEKSKVILPFCEGKQLSQLIVKNNQIVAIITESYLYSDLNIWDANALALLHSFQIYTSNYSLSLLAKITEEVLILYSTHKQTPGKGFFTMYRLKDGKPILTEKVDEPYINDIENLPFIPKGLNIEDDNYMILGFSPYTYKIWLK